jgi:hypothetical protein
VNISCTYSVPCWLTDSLPSPRRSTVVIFHRVFLPLLSDCFLPCCVLNYIHLEWWSDSDNAYRAISAADRIPRPTLCHRIYVGNTRGAHSVYRSSVPRTITEMGLFSTKRSKTLPSMVTSSRECVEKVSSVTSGEREYHLNRAAL